jgi:hypothetical protein
MSSTTKTSPLQRGGEGQSDGLEPYKEDRDYKKLADYILRNDKKARIFSPVPE